VRWGILGTGKIAGVLAAAIEESQDGELVAVGSRDAERASAFASAFGVPRSSDYAGVVDADDVEVVYVATYHPAHREWAIRAAEARKHVLCEKPLAMRHTDAAEIVDAARRHDVFLLEAFAYRSHPQTERLVELVRGGRIGELRMIDAAFGYDAGPRPDNYLMAHELGGGGILDVGCYPTSMAHLVAAAAAGAPAVPTVDVAAAGVIGPTGVDHTTAATLVFEGGIVARVACSIQANLENRVRIVGSRGSIEVTSPWLPGRIGREASIVVQEWGAEPEVLAQEVEPDIYTVEVQAVEEFVRKQERSPAVMPWEDSLANMATLDRWRSAIGLRYEGDPGAEGREA
jgi:predicted dehydrogenase